MPKMKIDEETQEFLKHTDILAKLTNLKVNSTLGDSLTRIVQAESILNVKFDNDFKMMAWVYGQVRIGDYNFFCFNDGDENLNVIDVTLYCSLNGPGLGDVYAICRDPEGNIYYQNSSGEIFVRTFDFDLIKQYDNLSAFIDDLAEHL